MFHGSLVSQRACGYGGGGRGGLCAQSQHSAVQVMIWNLATKESVIVSPVRTITCHQDVILSMSFNTNGSLLATACKDRKIRILDPRLGTIVQVSAGTGSGLESKKHGAEAGGEASENSRQTVSARPSLCGQHPHLALASLQSERTLVHFSDEKTEAKEA